jgi:hypothetical protein
VKNQKTNCEGLSFCALGETQYNPRIMEGATLTLGIAITTLSLIGAWFAIRAANRSTGRFKRMALVAVVLVFPPLRVAVRPGILIAGAVFAAAIIVFGTRLVRLFKR